MQPLEQDVISDLDDKTDDVVQAGRRPLHVRILIGLTIARRLAEAHGLPSEASRRRWPGPVTQVAEPIGQLFPAPAADDRRAVGVHLACRRGCRRR